MANGISITAIESSMIPRAGHLQPFVAIPENKAKEWVSLSYLQAVAAQVGLNIRRTEWDDGLDIELGSTKPVIPDFDCRNLFISLQVKATENWAVRDGTIPFFLKQSNYEQLRQRSIADQYLVVYTLPPCRSRWVRQRTNHIEFESRGFFFSLEHAPQLQRRSNGRLRSGKTIYVPVANRLTAASLRGLYVKAAERAKAMLNL